MFCPPGALVRHLLLHGSPAAVVWAVSAIVVDAVYCEPFLVSVRKRPGLKGGKVVQPFLTDRNPAPSVVLKALIMRICTAVLHARPYSVELCCCSTVNGAGFCGGLFLEAPTAFGVTASELPCSNIKLVSALAAAVPDGFLPGLADVVRRPAGNRQKSEGLPG